MWWDCKGDLGVQGFQPLGPPLELPTDALTSSQCRRLDGLRLDGKTEEGGLPSGGPWHGTQRGLRRGGKQGGGVGRRVALEVHISHRLCVLDGN